MRQVPASYCVPPIVVAIVVIGIAAIVIHFRQTDPDVQFRRATELAAGGDDEQAIRLLNAALERIDDPRMLSLRGRLHLRTRAIDRAEQDFRDLLERVPGDQGTVLALAACFHWRGDLRGAISVLDANAPEPCSLNSATDPSEIKRYKGFLLAQLEEYEAADDVLGKAIHLARLREHRRVAYVLRAYARVKSGKVEQAQGDLEAADFGTGARKFADLRQLVEYYDGEFGRTENGDN